MLTPLHNQVIVEALQPTQTTHFGMIIPDTSASEKPQQGTVIAAGPGKLLDNGQRAPMSVQPGQVVLFKKYAPDEIKIDGKDYLILSEDAIVAIIQ